MGQPQRTTSPSGQTSNNEPVSLSAAKNHLRVDLSVDDSLINTVISSAREWAEDFTDRTFFETEWTWRLDDFPAEDQLWIPRPPLLSISTVDYVKEDGTQKTFSSSKYLVDNNSEPGRIFLDNGENWPTDDLEPYNGVIIKFKAGYATNTAASDVPAPVRQAIKMLVAHWYEHRKHVRLNEFPREVPDGPRSLLYNFQTRRLASP